MPIDGGFRVRVPFVYDGFRLRYRDGLFHPDDERLHDVHVWGVHSQVQLSL